MTLPQCVEAERALAGACLSSSEMAHHAIVKGGFNIDDIVNPLCNRVVHAVCNLVQAGVDVDIVGVLLAVQKSIPSITLPDLTDLTSHCGSVVMAKEWISGIKEAAVRRNTLLACNKAQKAIGDGEITQEVLAALQGKLEAIVAGTVETKEMCWNDHLLDALARYETGDNSIIRISTGYSYLDKISPQGLGSYTVIGGMTKAGKTAFALQIVANMLCFSAKSALIVSLEMPASELVNRMTACVSGIPIPDLEAGLKTEGHIRSLQTAAVRMAKWKLVVRDDLHDLRGIVAHARAIKRSKVGLDVLVVDYIQLVRVAGIGRDSTREREVAEVSRTLRLLALELNCLVIALTQLNENGQARESRAISHDCTAAWVLKADKESDPASRYLEIPLQRNGQSGCGMRFTFDGARNSFSSMDIPKHGE